MPESRVRRTSAYTAPNKGKATAKPNPRWWVPVMVALMVAGLAYLVVTYLSQMAYPIPGLDYWNLAVGFVLIMLGFIMTTRWR